MKKARTARPIDVRARAGAKKASMRLNATASPINPRSGSLNFRVIRIPAATAITIEKNTSRVSKADQEELETRPADVFKYAVACQTATSRIGVRGMIDGGNLNQPSLFAHRCCRPEEL